MRNEWKAHLVISIRDLRGKKAPCYQLFSGFSGFLPTRTKRAYELEVHGCKSKDRFETMTVIEHEGRWKFSLLKITFSLRPLSPHPFHPPLSGTENWWVNYNFFASFHFFYSHWGASKFIPTFKSVRGWNRGEGRGRLFARVALSAFKAPFPPFPFPVSDREKSVETGTLTDLTKKSSATLFGKEGQLGNQRRKKEE